MSSSKCSGVTKQGAECKRNAREGFSTCYQHKDDEPDITNEQENNNEDADENENGSEQEEEEESEDESANISADKTLDLLQKFSSGNFTITTK
jgi:hypothetical protein